MTERRDGHDCWLCGSFFALVYRPQEGEGLEAAPVNCPVCGRLNYLPVARTAATAREYRTEKIGRDVSRPLLSSLPVPRLAEVDR